MEITKEEFLKSDEAKIVHLFGGKVVDVLVCEDNFSSFLIDFKANKKDLFDEFRKEYNEASDEKGKVLMENFENFYVDYFLFVFVPKVYVKYFLKFEYKNILLENKDRIKKYLLKEEDYESLIILEKIMK